ncbi:MAG TPA: hypothetical protein VJB87_05355 [Candidatus Nanoarchaeia archaeon]|nr:hypothetical protein [Candidatus Nanoarchaeia archaeon]
MKSGITTIQKAVSTRFGDLEKILQGVRRIVKIGGIYERHPKGGFFVVDDIAFPQNDFSRPVVIYHPRDHPDLKFVLPMWQWTEPLEMCADGQKRGDRYQLVE